MSVIGVTRWSLVAAGAAALVLTAAGCGSSSSHSSTTSQPAGNASTGGLKTGTTSIGTVLVDSRGRTVYELVGDTASHPTCAADCLAVWPAVEANGTQVVVNGHPAFTFVGDTAAGQTKGQNLTDKWGRWLALDASGNPISGTATSGSSAPAGSSSAPGAGGSGF